MNIGILPSVNLQNRNGMQSRGYVFVPAMNKKPKKRYYFFKRRESDDNNAVALVKIVPQLGCVSQDSDALVSQRGKQSREKPDAKSLGIDSKSTVHPVYATSSKYPGKERTITWTNTSQKSSSAKSRPMKRLKDNSDAPEARHGT